MCQVRHSYVTMVCLLFSTLRIRELFFLHQSRSTKRELLFLTGSLFSFGVYGLFRGVEFFGSSPQPVPVIPSADSPLEPLPASCPHGAELRVVHGCRWLQRRWIIHPPLTPCNIGDPVAGSLNDVNNSSCHPLSGATAEMVKQAGWRELVNVRVELKGLPLRSAARNFAPPGKFEASKHNIGGKNKK